MKLEPDMAAKARNIWREAQDPRMAPKRASSVDFELEGNFIFIPMMDRGEFVAGVLYAFGEDLAEAEEAAAEDPADLEDEEE